MSIFKESFPQFVIDELDRRQNGMRTRTPGFITELNTRNAWVRMTSGVNYEKTNTLAKQYVLQGGTLLNNTSLRSGLGGDGTSTYDLSSPGGVKQRLGIRPMPGITGVTVNSIGAYGSLQEATVSFVAWDIKQLEDLELLYMRPGYTVLLEFGWNYVKPLPKYDILNVPTDTGITLQDAFIDIYKKITDSRGNYDALLGYVKNYNWNAREDGGYDCTTTIISLGEVLESLKCNWVPMETVAFTNTGLLGYGEETGPSYELGIIPGMLHELFYYMDKKANSGNLLSYSRELQDPRNPGTKYQLFMTKRLGDVSKFNRGGLPKHLGSARTEGYITLASFCDLISNYVLLKNENNTPISQITTFENNESGVINRAAPLRCIANPLSLSTNYGICLVRNDNWLSLKVGEQNQESQQESQQTTTPPTTTLANDINIALNLKVFGRIDSANVFNRFKDKFERNVDLDYYRYKGDLKTDLEDLAREFAKAVEDIIVEEEIKTVNGQQTKELKYRLVFSNTNRDSFISSTFNTNTKIVNFLEYFYPGQAGNISVQANTIYRDLFVGTSGDPFKEGTIATADSTGKKWTPSEVKTLIQNIFSKYPTAGIINDQLIQTLPETATSVAQAATNVPGLAKSTLPFLIQTPDTSGKLLGNLGNIYVNIDFLYDQAISKNIASNDVQNKNTISIREYLQGILRQIQNSLGNINDFDIQVDNRNAIGRIVDLNYTGTLSPDPKLPFTLQIHNLNSVVRTYSFQSKIFPEMGSIIAISAQDATGIGKLGYDNATLVAWNRGIEDRLIPKRDFNRDISVSDPNNPTSFLFPFLTKLYTYFKALDGRGTSNPNAAYGGLDFAYRDFLANLNRFDPQNAFKAIIPTELSITMDGIGGIVIGNLFRINQDIVPKGYKSIPGRELGYIVVKLGHDISNNDWTTNIQAYPIILESSKSSGVLKKYSGQQYSGDRIITLSAGGIPITNIELPPPAPPTSKATSQQINAMRIASNAVFGQYPQGGERGLCARYSYSIAKYYTDVIKTGVKEVSGKLLPAGGNADSIGYRNNLKALGYTEYYQGIKSKADIITDLRTRQWEIGDIVIYYNTTNPAKNFHTQIYTEALSNFSNGFVWATSVPTNYDTDFVYKNEATNDYYYYIFKSPNPSFNISSQPPTPLTADDIAKILNDAATGGGTDENQIIKAIEQIKDKRMFIEVNSKVNIQGLLNEELGRRDRSVAESIKLKLATIGVTLTYTSVAQTGIIAGAIQSVKDIKIVF